MDPPAAYDIWSRTYDAELDNPLVLLDEALFEGLLSRVPIRGRRVLDVGCGTGRNWKKIMAREPAELVGYDVSDGMVTRLREKYPDAVVHLESGDTLSRTAQGSCDVIVSTLALAHFSSVEAAFRQWARVLCARGDVLVTDLHPAAAARCHTNFRHRGRGVKVRTSVRSLEALQQIAADAGFECLALEEKAIDASLRHHFVRANMLGDYQLSMGRPFIYGLHLRK